MAVFKRIPTVEDLKSDWHSFTTQFPLLAAILAPASVLFEIPALSQPWLSANDHSIADPLWSFVLSVVSLGFNVVANGLLVLRFSRTPKWAGAWFPAVITRLSAVCWLIKVRVLALPRDDSLTSVQTVIEIVNISLYAHKTSLYPISAYQEGFWCSVLSTLISGAISFLLVYHCTSLSSSTCVFIEAMTGIIRHGTKDSTEDRLEERHFMLSVLSFVSLLALEALVFSRIEGWQFFDGIYFATVSAFTIGFGDLSPTHTSSRILLFPFLIGSIALLGQQINMIIGYFSAKSEARKDAWRREYEQARQRAHEKAHPQVDLQREMEFLRKTRQREDLISNAWDLFYSLLGMCAFWAIGAVLFHFMEGWTYGISLYFSYIVFLTIG
jgi:potassium channel subfamily K